MRGGRTTAVALAGIGVAALAVSVVAGHGSSPNWWQALLLAIALAVPVTLGLILVTRRPGLGVGVGLVAFGVAPLIVSVGNAWGDTGTTAHPWPGAHLIAALSAGTWVLFYVPPALLAAVFPDGHTPSPRWRWLVYGWPIVIAAFLTGVVYDPRTYASGGGKVSGAAPTGLPAVVGTVLGLAGLAGVMALLIGSVVAIAVRYRRGDVLARRQIRWLAFSAFLLPPVLLVAWISILFAGSVTVAVAVGLVVVFFAMPLGTVVGVLRHDLYDIDRLLSRTVSYTVLTAVLTALFAVVELLGGLLVGRGAAVPVAVATLLCAAVFGRIRRPVQALVDRRFDRDRVLAAAALARFVDAVRTGTMQPEQVDVALRDALADPDLRIAYVVPAVDGSTTWLDGAGQRVTRPVDPAREIGGPARVLAAVGYGDRTAARPGLLVDLLREAHLPIEVARARIEVRVALAETEASRARLMQAGYDERRRLERDLHDGAQQRLVAVGMSLRLAQRHLPSGSTYSALDGAVAGLQDAVIELRRICHGLRPSGLDDGLHSALRTLVRTSPIPVELTVTTGTVHESVALTAYYVAAEAIANALKHALAQQMRVDVAHGLDQLHVTIVDDGCGGARIVPGSGLAGLVDRVSAGGGSLRVHSVLGHGTTVEARLPCAS